MHATQHPDGTFEFNGEQYRLVESGDGIFDVVGRDGTVAGRLQIASKRLTGPAAEPLPNADAPDVVKAIAKLVGTPRGALPLQ